MSIGLPATNAEPQRALCCYYGCKVINIHSDSVMVDIIGRSLVVYHLKVCNIILARVIALPS